MPVTFEQLKSIVIKEEEKFIFEQYENEGMDSVPYIEEMKEEISGCTSIAEILDWYDMRGFDEGEKYVVVIKMLMKATSLTNK